MRRPIETRTVRTTLTAFFLATSLAATALLAPLASEQVSLDVASQMPSHETPRATSTLEVLCLESGDFDAVAGVTLRLCPEDVVGQPEDVLRRECIYAFADAEGRARFDGLESREYRLQADLEGFADTSIGPLGLGDVEPRAPRQVVVVLNPVCRHC